MCKALTPPKYQAKQHAAEEVMELEKRLEQFVEWLNEKGVHLCEGQANSRSYKFNDLSEAKVSELIEEYVNT